MPHSRVSLSQAGGGYDHQVAKSSLKELPETLASTAEGVPLALVEAMGVTIERLQEIVAIAATSILSLGLPRLPCLPLHAPAPPSPPKWCLLAPRGGHLRVPTLSLCSDGVLARRRLPFDARPVFCCHRGAGQRHRREARIGATTSPSRA